MKYSATHFVQALNETMPRNHRDNEVAIKNWERNIIDEEAVVTIDYPKLNFTRKKPTKVNDLLQLTKAGENQYVLLTEIAGERKEIPLKYDPTEESLYWGTDKFIKR